MATTPQYTPKDWTNGEVINEEALDNIEQGIVNTNTGVRTVEDKVATLETQTVKSVAVESVEPETPASGTIEEGVLTLKIPKGAKGDKGENGTNGTDGANGDPGEKGEPGENGEKGDQGASFRVSATALEDSKADIAADALSPTHAALPYRVGDTVLDATTKKLYAITEVTPEGVATIGTALATLP